MNVGELRCGNLLIASDTPDIIEVYQLDYDSDNRHRINYMGDHNFKPIKLTDEWLLKFGFYNWGDDKEYFNSTNGYVIELLNQGVDYRVFDSTGVTMCFIKYVHQLQNLYFALTCEELKINP